MSDTTTTEATTMQTATATDLNADQRHALRAYAGCPEDVERLQGEPSSPGRRAVRVTLSTGWQVDLGQYGAVLAERQILSHTEPRLTPYAARALDPGDEILYTDPTGQQPEAWPVRRGTYVGHGGGTAVIIRDEQGRRRCAAYAHCSIPAA